MKLKLLAYTFSVPLVWLAILLLKLIVPEFIIPRFFGFAVLLGLLCGSLIAIILFESKYLINLTLDNEKLLLTYLTPLARQRQIIIHLDTIVDVKLKKKIFIFRDFSAITLYSKANELKFYLFNSEVKRASQELLRTNSNRQVKSGT